MINPNEVASNAEVQKINCLKLTQPRNIITVQSFNTRTSDNHYVVKYYQYKMETLKLDCIHEVFCDIISEPAFNELRTKKQLGYMCGASYKNSYGALGLTIEVKSSVENHKTDYIRECIEEFCNDYLLNLFNELSDEKFDTHRKSLIVAKQAKDDCLNDEVKRNLNYIIEGDRHMDGSCPFDMHIKKVEVLEKLSRDDVKKYALDFLKNAKILDVIVEGNVYGDKNGVNEAGGKERDYNFMEESTIAKKNFNHWDTLCQRNTLDAFWKI